MNVQVAEKFNPDALKVPVDQFLVLGENPGISFVRKVKFGGIDAMVHDLHAEAIIGITQSIFLRNKGKFGRLRNEHTHISFVLVEFQVILILVLLVLVDDVESRVNFGSWLLLLEAHHKNLLKDVRVLNLKELLHSFV